MNAPVKPMPAQTNFSASRTFLPSFSFSLRWNYPAGVVSGEVFVASLE